MEKSLRRSLIYARRRSLLFLRRHGFLILLNAVLIWMAIMLMDSFAYGAEPIDPAYANRIVDAIWISEGGTGTKWPYGIKSVKCEGRDECRRICLNTVRNNWLRWDKAGRPGEYIDFLANRYCPIESDPTGNKNWKRNVKTILEVKK